jgi:L,D-peptidoglycan transpeptidase YkuD (ErfK/YbiS/YcfS/YnhG family)
LIEFGCGISDDKADSEGNVAILETKEGGKKIDSEQFIIANSGIEDSCEGVLWGIELVNDNWIVTFDSILCTFGKNGLAESGTKIEGDGKTPSGVFSVGLPFGYKNDLGIDKDFIELSDDHYWVSDTNSQSYNKLVDYYPEGVYAEKMKRNDHLYKYGIIVEYNTENTIKGKGSAIFIHIERKEGAPTAGCVAISEKNIKKLIEWLKPEKKPMIIIGNADEINFKSWLHFFD